jgi:hypothetical protein
LVAPRRIGAPSVSNCLSVSAVAAPPAWLSACWIASSASSIEVLEGISTWTV